MPILLGVLGLLGGGCSENPDSVRQWGVVQFVDAPVGTDIVDVRVPLTARIKWSLRRLHYRQRQYRDSPGHHASSLSTLDAAEFKIDGPVFTPSLQTTQGTYEITAPGPEGTTVHIRSDGKTWTPPK